MTFDFEAGAAAADAAGKCPGKLKNLTGSTPSRLVLSARVSADVRTERRVKISRTASL